MVDVPFAEKALRGVVMEIEDASYPLLSGKLSIIVAITITLPTTHITMPNK